MLNDKQSGQLDAIRKRWEDRQKCPVSSKRLDGDGDVEWITVKGTHIPVKDGKAVGGPDDVKKAINSGETKRPATTKEINSNIRRQWKNGKGSDYKAVEKGISDAFSRMQVGDSYTFNGLTTKKIGDNLFEQTDEDGYKERGTEKEFKDSIKEFYHESPDDPPVFKYNQKLKTLEPETVAKLNNKIRDLWGSEDSDVSSHLSYAVKQMSVGDTINFNGLQTKKTGKDTFKAMKASGDGYVTISGDKLVRELSDKRDYGDFDAPVFHYKSY